MTVSYALSIPASVAWVLIALWLSVPCVYGYLLWRDRVAIRTQRITMAADHTRYLWKEYQREFFFWEIIEVVRKLFLTTFIVIVVQDNASSMRLVIAIFVSIFFLAVQALAMPYTRKDDDYFAVLVNLLLTFVFLSGLLVKLCGIDESARCLELFGMTSADSLTEFFSVLTIAVCLGAVLVVSWKATVAAYAPTIRLKATHREPLLEMPSGNFFHAFISHVWYLTPPSPPPPSTYRW